MSEAVIAAPAVPSGRPYFEHRIFLWSPFGTLVTATLIFVAFFGSYLAISALQGLTPVTWIGDTLSIQNGAWPAFVLSLLITDALAMQRYARLKDAADRPLFAEIFKGGDATAARLSSYAPDDARLVRATLIGVCLGGAASAIIMFGQADHTRTIGIMIWFAVAITFSSVLFARGAELTRRSSASFAATLQNELKIDLLRIDKLSVIGRSSARSALIWFAVSAAACLFLVGGSIDVPSVAIMVACAGMGLLMFLRAIMGVHRKIRSAKAEELEHVRTEIDRARAALTSDAAAAMRVQGLLAYEARIQNAPEWPFDQSTLVRVGASALIVTVPWFGQAAVGYAIEHFAR